MNKKTKDVIIVGFALFAIFFGAGNLIFPPYLGVLSGSEYKKAMLGFLLTDPVLPILGVIVTAKLGGGAYDLGKRVGLLFLRFLEPLPYLPLGHCSQFQELLQQPTRCLCLKFLKEHHIG